MTQNKIYGWCFKDKKTNKLEPFEWRNWEDGYGIFGTKKLLLDNYWGKIPEGLTPVRVEIKLIVK